MRAAAEEGALWGLWFIGQKYFPVQTETWVETPEYPVFGALRVWLENYFDRQKPAVEIPLAPRGGRFRQSVWRLLLEIPSGETTTYGALAARISGGFRMSSRAVGGAVGHNPISVIIPCHRVLGADGSLTGYAGGLEKKQALLELEGWTVAGAAGKGKA
jgi:methylated-DNA-[protein]-cysteine S-methyltransferase